MIQKETDIAHSYCLGEDFQFQICLFQLKKKTKKNNKNNYFNLFDLIEELVVGLNKNL